MPEERYAGEGPRITQPTANVIASTKLGTPGILDILANRGSPRKRGTRSGGDVKRKDLPSEVALGSARLKGSR